MYTAVFGLGKSGRSACRYLRKQGFHVLASDDKKQESGDFEEVSPEILMQKLPFCSFLISSPGISLNHPIIQQAKKLGIELFCDVEYAFRMRTQGYIGITGTNGKTTTTLLTNHLMNYAEIPAKAVGNVGVPILDEVHEIATLVVELSSFQLQMISTPALQAAALLNISANHLDHHTSMEEYVQAKLHIGGLLQKGRILFVGEKVALCWNQNCQIERFGFTPSCEIFSDGIAIWRYGIKEGAVPTRLQGSLSHDLENFLAAYALCRNEGVSAEKCIDGYDSFCKPAHRLQLIREHQGVKFYDDSKATNIDAVVRAVETLQERIVLIAGGVHKGHPYSSWKEKFPGKVKEMFLIGPAASLIEKDLEAVIPTTICLSLDEAVQKAMSCAIAGDNVLLSPGCSSYDSFANFEERGKMFQKLVSRL